MIAKKSSPAQEAPSIDYDIQKRTRRYWMWIDESGHLPGNADHLPTFREAMRKFLVGA